MLFLLVDLRAIRVTQGSQVHLAYQAWMEDLEGMDCKVHQDPKVFLGLSWLKVNVDPQDSLEVQASLETGVQLAPQDLVLRVLLERKVFRAFQADQGVQVHQARKVNRVKLCRRKGLQVLEEPLEILVCRAVRVLLVSPDSLVSQGYQGQRVNLDSLALAYQGLLDSKDSLGLLARLEFLELQVAQVWMGCPVSQASQGPRVSLAMVYQDPRGLQDFQVRKDSLGQRVIPDSLGPLASLGDQALMEDLARKVILVILAHLELVALQVPLHMAFQGPLALLAVLDLWVLLDSLVGMGRRVTLDPQDWTSLGYLETGGTLASLDHQVLWALLVPLAHQAEMDNLDCPVQREIWGSWEPLDLLDTWVPLVHLDSLDQKATTAFLDSQGVQVVQG